MLYALTLITTLQLQYTNIGGQALILNSNNSVPERFDLELKNAHTFPIIIATCYVRFSNRIKTHRFRH